MTVVYTALLGGCDTLKEAPYHGVDACICYTDDPRHLRQGRGWQFRMMATPEPRRTAWRLRCESHRLFPEADTVIWFDASMVIRDVPRFVADAGSADVVGLAHPERTSCYDEADLLVADGKATRAGVDRQCDAYRAEGYVPSGLTTAGILLRRHTPRVRRFNERWAREIATYPDDNCQLSLDYSAWREGVPVVHAVGTYIDNPYVTYDQADHASRRRPYR